MFRPQIGYCNIATLLQPPASPFLSHNSLQVQYLFHSLATSFPSLDPAPVSGSLQTSSHSSLLTQTPYTLITSHLPPSPLAPLGIILSGHALSILVWHRTIEIVSGDLGLAESLVERTNTYRNPRAQATYSEEAKYQNYFYPYLCLCS